MRVPHRSVSHDLSLPERKEFLDTASRLYLERGIAAVSMEQLAAASGLELPRLQKAFSSHSAILAALVQPAVDDLDEILADVQAVSARSSQVVVLLERFVRWIVNHRIMMRLSDDPQLRIDPAAGPLFAHMRDTLVQAQVTSAASEEQIVRIMVALGGATLVVRALPEADPEWLQRELLDVTRPLVGPSI